MRRAAPLLLASSLTCLLAMSACARPASTRGAQDASVTPRPDAAMAIAPRPEPDVVPSSPGICEVEISGRVVAPKKARRSPAPLVFVTIGDCLAEKPQVVGFSGTFEGKFFVEVFVPWGSDLTLCAAVEPTEKAPSVLYGKASIAMHAEKSGEIEFRDVTVDLAPGPPRAWPHRQGAPEQ